MKLLETEVNSGPMIARNRGLDAAAGKYIAFLDFDDLWPADKLEKQITFMKKNNLAMTYTGYKKFYDDGSLKSGLTVPVPLKITYDMIIKSNSVIISTAMYDRDKIGELRQDLNAPLSKDDMHFWLSVLERCSYGIGIKDDLCRFRIHKGSITNNKMKVAKIHWKFFRETMNLSVIRSVYYYFIYSVKRPCKNIFFKKSIIKKSRYMNKKNSSEY